MVGVEQVDRVSLSALIDGVRVDRLGLYERAGWVVAHDDVVRVRSLVTGEGRSGRRDERHARGDDDRSLAHRALLKWLVYDALNGSGRSASDLRTASRG